MTESVGPPRTGTVAENRRFDSPGSRVPVLIPVTPSTPSRSFVLGSDGRFGTVSRGIPAICATVGSASASRPSAQQVRRGARVALVDPRGLHERRLCHTVRGEPLRGRLAEARQRAEGPVRQCLGIVAGRDDEHGLQGVVLAHRDARRHGGDRGSQHVVLVVEGVVGSAERDRGAGVVRTAQRALLQHHERRDEFADARDRARVVAPRSPRRRRPRSAPRYSSPPAIVRALAPDAGSARCAAGPGSGGDGAAAIVPPPTARAACRRRRPRGRR